MENVRKEKGVERRSLLTSDVYDHQAFRIFFLEFHFLGMKKKTTFVLAFVVLTMKLQGIATTQRYGMHEPNQRSLFSEEIRCKINATRMLRKDCLICVEKNVQCFDHGGAQTHPAGVE